ncbi:26798_t:CDS:2, partial [Dentiscutata erythropus]
MTNIIKIIFSRKITAITVMHGRKRVKPTAEVEKLRKEKEASKIKEYNGIVAACFEKKSKCEFDKEAFILTTKILSQNPDFYTIWNLRRSILLNEISEDCSEEEKQQKFSSELLFLQEVFRHNPKSYWIFNHRRWCLDTMPNPDWKSELDLVGKMLDMDARNFHGWDYRRYVITRLSCIDSNALNLCKTEFDFTTTKINQNFSNYSAWHQRSKLLPNLLEDEQLGDQGKKNLIDQEFELVKSAFYTDPDDQSAWLYHWWLIGRDILPLTKQERINLLKREIATVKELQEIEPESKWCLQTLLVLLRELKYISELNTKEAMNIDEEVITICDQLMNIDKMRAKRFEDLRSKVIFEKTTNNLVQTSPNAQQEIIKDKG